MRNHGRTNWEISSMNMATTLKSIVSKKKCRYKEGKFDLDLTYILPRVIAMGYPAEKVEAIYRNDYQKVKEFLDKKHGSHYWVYNLCSERERIYDKSKFDGRVSCYAFDDHHPPVFSLIQPFCDEVRQYLEEDERNVAVVHCKAGKGRTGVMICCYLLNIQHCPSAPSVLQFYANKRTTDQKGVTIPSQRRYITYYDAMNRRGLEYKPVKLYLKDIVLDPAPTFSTGQSYISLEVTYRGRKEPYVSKHILCRKHDRNVSLSINPPLLLSGDVKFEFSTKAKFSQVFGQKVGKPDKPFHFWLNTFFVDMELDGGLAHDLTGTNPIIHEATQGSQGHVHHASGSSEDSSTDDIPLKPPTATQQQNGLCVTFREPTNNGSQALRQTSVPVTTSTNGPAGDTSEVTNLVKLTSISDDHLLQDRSRTRQTETFSSNSNSHISSMGPLSTSDENASTSLSSQHHAGDDSSTSSCTTTTESFIQQRLRHTSMPQARVCSSAGLVQHEHHHLEPSLSHEVSSASHNTKHHHPFFSASRHHATITSNSAASLEAAHGGAPGLNVAIPGKNLSLRLKKGQIDKAHKDKACRNFPDNFSVTLFLVKPADQSDNLLDYSLYSTALLMSMDSHSTITTMNNHHQQYANDKFTVMPVLSNPPNQRQRPGQSGDSSSTTPSLKSTEQSSQDSVSGSDNESGADIQTTTIKLQPPPPHPSATSTQPQPQSTAI